MSWSKPVLSVRLNGKAREGHVMLPTRQEPDKKKS